MKKIVILLVLSGLLLISSGCSYWPQAARPEYYKDSMREVKEDIDDVAGARTL